MNVLFIGNSYTYYNDMPMIFQAMARSAGLDLTAYSATKGGWSLYQYAFNGDEYSRMVDEALPAHPYEAVFLQDLSLGAIVAPEKMAEGMRALAGRVQALGARVLLYQTWARRADNDKLKEHGLTPDGMEEIIRAAYEKEARALNARVSYAGAAFKRAVSACPDIELYAPDGSHPSYAGSYLAACMHLNTATGIMPGQIVFDGELSPETAQRLRDIASAEICARA